MDDLYREVILDHYRNPRNKGELEHPSHTFQDDNPLCGDRLRIDLIVNDQDIIEQVRFNGEGCAISMASASMLSEMLGGKTVEQAKAIGKQDILDALGIELGPVRLKCALLSLKVLKGAVYGLPTDLEED
jgi:nitrogen fixation NifU-like protein